MLIKWLQRMRAFLIFLMLFVAVFGTAAFFLIQKESTPEIDIPIFAVSTIVKWADPQTVEQQVTKPLETKLSAVPDLTKLKSVSVDNFSYVYMEFNEDADLSEINSNLQTAVNAAKTSFPDSAQEPKIEKISLVSRPTYVFVVKWNWHPQQMYALLGDLQDELEKINWVSSVDIIWGEDDVLKVKLDYQKLLYFNVPFWAVYSKLTSQFLNLPGDKKFVNDEIYSYQLSSYPLDIEELLSWTRDTDIINFSWLVLKLKDLGDVFIAPKFSSRSTYVADYGKTSPALSFVIHSSPGEDIPRLIQKIETVLDKRNPFFEKHELVRDTVYSEQEVVDDVFGTFKSNFRQTALIIFAVVVVFMGLRQAGSIFLVFPLVYLMTFLYLLIVGFSFNNIVSFSLILTLGIMVDNLIVILEWFESGLAKGMSKWESIWYSINTYRKSLVSWNMTTIAMFVPISLFLTGVMGSFMKYMPATVNSTLIFSLLAAILFLPIVLSVVYKDKQQVKASKDEDFFAVKYVLPLLDKVLRRPKIVIFATRILFAFTISLLVFKVIKVDFLGKIDSNNIYVNLKFSPTVYKDENEKFTAKMIDELLNEFEYKDLIEFVQVNIGTLFSMDPMENVAYNAGFNPNYNYWNIKLVDKNDRRVPSYKISASLQKWLLEQKQRNPQLDEIGIVELKWWPGGWKDITFNVYVDSYQDSAELINQIFEKVSQISWTFWWDNGFAYSPWKLQILRDKDVLSDNKITPWELDMFVASVQNSVKYEPAGVLAHSFYDFWDDELQMRLWTVVGEKVPLEELVYRWLPLKTYIREQKITPEIKFIKHLDSKKVVQIGASKQNTLPLGAVKSQIDKIMKTQFPDVKYDWGSDIEMMQDSSKSLAIAFLAGLFLMFGVLILHFGNFRQPILIFSTIPLLLIGAFLLLGALRLPFSFAAQLGLFGLIGVGINNSILLLDKFNSLASKWIINIDQALRETVAKRVKPLFLTSLTTILGLSMLALKDELWAWLSIAFIGGLLLGVLLILLVLPAKIKLDWYKTSH